MQSYFNWKTYHPSPLLKMVHITLLILILIGTLLLLTQRMWVPKLVTFILEKEGSDKALYMTDSLNQ